MNRRTRALLPTLAVVLALGVGGNAPVVAADDTSPVTVDLHVGTYNIRSDRSLEQFQAGVDAFEQEVDVAGLQEIGSTTKSHYLRDSTTWGYYRPTQLQQNPVIWDKSKFRFDGGRGFLLAHGTDTGTEDPRRTESRRDSYATVVHLTHLQTQERISVINAHLLSGAVIGGRRYPGRPLMFKIYVKQVASLARLYAAEAARVANGELDRVFVLGDFNVGYRADRRVRLKRLPFATLRRAALIAVWRKYDVDHGGTHGTAYLDQVWSTSPVAPGGAKVDYAIRESDHFPVIATYRLDLLPVLPTLP